MHIAYSRTSLSLEKEWDLFYCPVIREADIREAEIKSKRQTF
jgi:hypothetical protein